MANQHLIGRFDLILTEVMDRL